MQNKYYYLVATLPYLKLAAEPPISTKTFLEECGKWLTEKDLQAVSEVGANQQKETSLTMPLLKEWKEFDGALRESLAKERAANKAKEQSKQNDEIKRIISQGNPLLVEKEFEAVRWAFLEDKEPLYQFDVNSLVIYHLKLQITERLTTFNKDKGENYFYKLCEVEYENKIG